MKRIFFTALIVANLLNGEEIHVFGDSHSRSFSSITSHIHYLGPRTMHRVGRDGIAGLNIKKYGVNEGDICIFCFGEIDIRCHVIKQASSGKRNLVEVIESLAKNYLKTLDVNREQFSNVKIIIANITPPTNVAYNTSFPYFGTLSERIFATQLLDETLMKKCFAQDNMFFLEYSSYYQLDDRSLNPELSDGNVHIKNALYIKQELADLLEAIKTYRSHIHGIKEYTLTSLPGVKIISYY